MYNCSFLYGNLGIRLIPIKYTTIEGVNINLEFMGASEITAVICLKSTELKSFKISQVKLGLICRWRIKNSYF